LEVVFYWYGEEKAVISGGCLRIQLDPTKLTGDFKVKRSRTLTDTTRDVIMRAVARTVPTAVITGFTNRHTTPIHHSTQIVK
jgi:hypothetical protein